MLCKLYISEESKEPSVFYFEFQFRLLVEGKEEGDGGKEQMQNSWRGCWVRKFGSMWRCIIVTCS